MSFRTFSLKHKHTLGMVVSLTQTMEKELAYKESVLNRRKRENVALNTLFTFEDIIGESEALQTALYMARAVAKTDTKLLVEGESGTGKELFVQAIHQASSRTGGPFVPINCSAIPNDLIESELFGYQEGAHSELASK